MAIYSTMYPEVGPIPFKVKCPTCGEIATLSSHNHTMKDKHGIIAPLWMPMGWHCNKCNKIFCQVCEKKRIQVVTE